MRNESGETLGLDRRRAPANVKGIDPRLTMMQPRLGQSLGYQIDLLVGRLLVPPIKRRLVLDTIVRTIGTELTAEWHVQIQSHSFRM